MKTEHVESGQEIEYDCKYWYWEVCCDCGLAHYVSYRYAA